MGYSLRMLLALALLGGFAFVAMKYVPSRFRLKGQGQLKLLGVLNLGRDSVYLLQVGPDVVAVFSGRNGTETLGRWNREEWDDFAAATGIDQE